jgi:hypothetical protein
MPIGYNCEYEDFDACVAANQDREDPERYCGWLQQETEDQCKGGEGMKKKVFKPKDLELKIVEDESGIGYVEGYASVFGNRDSMNEVVEKGAFAKTIQESIKSGKVKFVDFHNSFASSENILGVVEEAEEDDYGLKFKARLSSTQRAQDVRTKIKEGILDALSIGYDVVKDNVEGQLRYLTELKLWEISVVPWGANPKAGITGVKSNIDLQLKEFIDNVKAMEQKEGRVLSATNKRRVEEAIEALQALLNAVEPEKSTQHNDEPDNHSSELMEGLKELRLEVNSHKIREELEDFRRELQKSKGGN